LHFQDITMDVIDLPLEQIIPYARNPRNNAEAVATVAASIQEFGWRQPIVVDEDRVVLAGHTRLEAARKLGFKSAPVHIAKGLTANQARAFRIMDNRSGENAEWDNDLLNLELADLLEANFDLSLTGFTDDELNALVTSLEDGSDPQSDEDDVPEAPEDPISRPGDLWILGHHRLLCGDSTVVTDVDRVLGAVKPLLMVTDPPYGVDYDPGWRNETGAAKTKRTGKVLNDDRADWRDAWALFPGDVAYVWHGALHAATVAESLQDCGFTIRSQIIWAKERLVLSRGDYHWQHEPCQPAGTLVQKVIERGAGSQPALIGEVPIETLQVGDFVVSYNPYESVVRRRGRQITRFGERQFDGFMHAISAAGRVTRATPEHRFSVRLNPNASDKQVVYLMRRGDWWRVGRVGLFNSRGFGLATRLADNMGEEAWIVSVHDSVVEAQCAEQVLSCKYGIPTTHWEVDAWTKNPDRVRSQEMIAGIYASLNLSALNARATQLLRDHRLERDYPFIASGEKLNFSRRATRLVRSCNVFAKIMQLPMPTVGEDFTWVTVTGNDATPFSGSVYSMDVERDQHYVADGLVTHNCWYAVKKTGKGHWAGDRKQTTLWHIANKDQDEKTVHGTQKPVECMRRPILNNSSPGQVVYEPFMGSGTTLIAAESTGRVCYGIELNPAYVDVAVERWQKFTGQEAVLESSGERFNSLKNSR
jgi:DNA modification methylase